MISAYSDDILAADPALRLLIDTRAALIGEDQFGADVAADLADCVGGIALEAEVASEVSASFFTDVLERIEALEADQTQMREAAQAAGRALDELLGLPQPLRDLSLDAIARDGWAFAGPGVKSMVLDTGGTLRTKLMRIEPGHGAPHHDHTGTEYTLVVCGAFADETGRFGPGDLSVKHKGQVHHPVALPGPVCLALTVEEGDIALTGALGLLQRLFTRH
ncbi:anti-sigma-E factor ChrR [Candidatus Phycosocius bacilliformis]|uniref:Anti-sigma-E factor ChrR n=1 Tax=Candidatus Phycosocius bacilliformis TaxID=1445552 RepID=A0A2P2ECI0_9PROT|nr:cupin domain-containing protein [Candidatus Phycosocius bacilliformis]GBF58763.1 anti-sigma-E factor ChrR [Candidatus Phycosocius bacilliformis]